MARTINFTIRNDSFRQGFDIDNVEVTLNLFSGNDTVLLNRDDDLGGGNIVNAGRGNDSVINLKESGNIIRLGSGNDTYVGRGFGSFATDPGDTVFGGLGNDTIAVETFKSSYFGGRGGDKFFSVGWQNNFHGGLGRDLISYEPRDEDSTQGGTGITADLAQGLVQTGANRFENLVSIEDIIGTAQGDVIAGTEGKNRITGGLGLDQMAGRGGADRFIFRSIDEAAVVSDAIDVIDDFSSAQGDKINLRGIDANIGAGGNQAFVFIAGQGFSGVAGQLRFADNILSGDVNGDGIEDFRIGLRDVDAMQASDFLL
jgi:Ca2+-binding RTX toxin-like protein